MKKQRRKAPANAKKPSPTPAAPAQDRRSFLKRARNIAIGIGVVSLGGFFAIGTVRATIAEHDLSRLGNGIPTIVQIHDPQCRMCQALQRETRDALGAFDEGEIQYLVADISQSKGLAFAGQHGVSHVTLMLFDGKGTVKNVLNGVRQSAELEHAFSQLTRSR